MPAGVGDRLERHAAYRRVSQAVLDDLQPGVREHELRVEHAPKRPALYAHAFDSRQRHLLHDGIGEAVRRPPRRAVHAHATGHRFRTLPVTPDRILEVLA